MPYVKRHWKGHIVGIFATSQPDIAEEFLPDDNPEILAFFLAHQPPVYEPMTTEELIQEAHRMMEIHDRLKEEHKNIKIGIVAIIMAWADIENALCGLLKKMIDSPSQIGSAMYFSLSGLDARIGLVDAAFQRLCREQPTLLPAIDFWKDTIKTVQRIKRTRNSVAHGAPITLNIGGNSHARLTSPFLDIQRFEKSMDRKQVLGMSANDILASAKTTKLQEDRIQDVTRLVHTHWDGDIAGVEKFLSRMKKAAKDKANPDKPKAPGLTRKG